MRTADAYLAGMLLDLALADSLLQALSDDARLVLVGDVDQLPSVGPGRVLADLMSGKRAEIEASDLGYARYVKEGRKGMRQGGGMPVPA